MPASCSCATVHTSLYGRAADAAVTTLSTRNLENIGPTTEKKVSVKFELIEGWLWRSDHGVALCEGVGGAGAGRLERLLLAHGVAEVFVDGDVAGGGSLEVAREAVLVGGAGDGAQEERAEPGALRRGVDRDDVDIVVRPAGVREVALLHRRPQAPRAVEALHRRRELRGVHALRRAVKPRHRHELPHVRQPTPKRRWIWSVVESPDPADRLGAPILPHHCEHDAFSKAFADRESCHECHDVFAHRR
mmetsp:Transcript_19612/g.63691  ORF Transcript_19612/g.63691 Transcript_19612/m.63691 type:complete len:247 (-) Transcript_19612:239-979(-)